MTHRTAVIGAGLAGLACARVLRRAGFYVEVFEQDRIIGGRIATTRVGLTSFDHGAQYITARGSTFRSYIDEIDGTGYAARWLPVAQKGGERGGGQMHSWYVGTPGMSAIVRPLAEGVRIHTGRRAHTLQRVDHRWHIWFEDETTTGPFAAVAVAVPAPEARLLVGPLDRLAEPLSRVRMSPCWALMVRVEQQLLHDQDVYSDMSDIIRWVARNNSKPGRTARGDNIVIHASQAWSHEAEDAAPDMVAEELWNEVSHLLGLPPTRPSLMTAHLWRQGLVNQSLGETYIYSGDDKVGLAGDWCIGRLAEHAFESGIGLGRAIVQSLV